MADDAKTISILNEQLTAITDTRTNLAGLMEKATTVQLALMDGGLNTFADEIGNTFSKISAAMDELQETQESMEMERNRLRNE